MEVEDAEAPQRAAGVLLEVEREADVVRCPARAEEDERLLARGAFERATQPRERAPVEVHRRSGLEDDEPRAGATVGEQPGKRVDVVAAQQLRRVGPQLLDRSAQALKSFGLIGPHECL